MLRPSLSVICLILTVLLLLGTAQANAGCPPLGIAVYVGNTATDNECDYDSIQAAIDAAVCPTTIVITTQRTWSGQHLNITDKSLTLTGGDGNCGSVIDPGVVAPRSPTGITPPARVSLSASDGVDDSVIEITGNSHVTLRNLTISGSRQFLQFTEETGGGILFDGHGALTLSNVVIMDNYAGAGGGIAVLANGGHAELHIQSNTVIHHNTAQTLGGGVAMAGDAHLLMVEPQSTIAFNTARGVDANGDPILGGGGGLAIVGAQADIGSPGLDPGLGATGITAAIARNSAPNGGGVFIFPGDGTNARLRVFTTDAGFPATLRFNDATLGGALLASDRTNVCLFNANLTDNIAANGSAVAVGGGLYLNADPYGVCDAASLPALGAVPCPSGQACNLVARNNSMEAGSPTSGPVIYIAGGTLHANRFAMSDNTAGYGIRGFGTENTYFLRNCLLADNNFKFYSLLANGGPSSIDHCTFANNALNSANFEIVTDSDIRLTRSIVHESAGNLTLDVTSSEATVVVQHVLSSDLSTLPSRPDIITGDPHFGGSASGNYRLQPDSPAIDFAPGSEGKDLDFRPRKVDLPYVTNVFGPGDLGAYEFQLAGYTDDTLFYDGFEIVGPPTLQ